jgi:hypothetical protein
MILEGGEGWKYF